MAAEVTVVAGPAQSGKTRRVLAKYQEALASGETGSALWLSPTRRASNVVRESVLTDGLTACFSPNCLTFAQFTQRVLDASQLAVRSVSPLLERNLLRRAITRAADREGLEYFGPIAHTPGMLDLLVSFVRELKRLEIWPEHFLAACRRPLQAKDRELHRLYAEYQVLLTEHQLYDAEGKFWSARELLTSGQRRPWQALRHIFVDGFTDFTRTEYEILEILAEGVESLTITLPLDAADGRDFFAKPRRTLEELGRRHAALRLETLARTVPPAWPALGHLEARVFGNPRAVEPAPETRGIEILAAAGHVGEVEGVASRVKQLLVEGDRERGTGPVQPGEVLVVFRSLTETAPIVREVFAQWGIPCDIAQRQSLDQAPAITALFALLRVHLEDWPFRPLLALLTNNYFQPNWPEWQAGRAARAAEYIVRHLQIPAGRRELLGWADRWARQEPIADSTTDGRQDLRSQRTRHAQLARPLLTRLDDALAQLPRRATATAWARALTKLATDVGILGNRGISEALSDRDRLAWEQIVAALEALDCLAVWLDEEPPQFPAAELLDHLSEIVRNEHLPADHDEVGRVRVLDAPGARNLSAPYVFLAGLSERAFPQAQREDRLYSEAETMNLIEAGLPLVAGLARGQAEMLLFYEMLTRARRRLYLSYSALDAKGQPLSPSPYLTEVERACGKGKIVRHADADLSPVPRTNDLFSPRDFRVKAVAAALEGDRLLLAGLRQADVADSAGENIASGLRGIHARQRGTGFGPFDGILEGGAARQKLAERFGPQRCWSPSQLEQYASCPYQFLLQRVLHLKELPELGLEVDYLIRGRALHAALAAVHQQINDRWGTPTSVCGQDEEVFLRESAEILARFFDQVRSGQPIEDGLREIDRRLVGQWIGAYHAQHRKYDENWKECDTPLLPTYFEVSFGPLANSDAEQAELERTPADPPSTQTPYEIVCGKEVVRLYGRIDRIDVGTVGGQTVFNIVDYKSGASNNRLSAKAVEEGYALQLPLYALAVQELLLADRNAVPWRIAYWYVRGNGYKEIFSCYTNSGGRLQPSVAWRELRARLVARVAALVQSIREGQFPMFSADDQCTAHCPYSTVCRVNQVRALEKTWQPLPLSTV